MSSIEKLKQQALDVFGQSLSDQQLEAYKGRLPTMLQNVKLLERWGKRLEQAHPAQIQYLIEVREGGGDAGNE